MVTNLYGRANLVSRLLIFLYNNRRLGRRLALSESVFRGRRPERTAIRYEMANLYGYEPLWEGEPPGEPPAYISL